LRLDDGVPCRVKERAKQHGGEDEGAQGGSGRIVGRGLVTIL
jgi:hypothetical protein